ncbi:hypothetical protein [Desulfocurvibacter africanus]|uniref:Uncharacterized protein n=1 Tax=Desulfocurvibacter africanus subsp. africanus str. Walvis Bay TaxID=690850 RepID=F3YW62_DESAF|nr:hypothetical protein [Desulfocurvibacter africanus]EGJ49165.1 hypothetical protein Desaf_0814 [Desulfocurvibacter africanus subsp. africanus str. Walvis Bay]
MKISRKVLQAESVPETPLRRPELDILEMPYEGLAAYWLSLKKLLDEKQDTNFLLEEAAYTNEPYVRHLLETAFSALDEERAVRLGKARQDILLEGYRRRFACMRTAIRAIIEAESPRLSLIRMLSHFPAPPIPEAKAAELAQSLLRGLAMPDADKAVLLEIDSRTKADRLMVKLMAYVTLGRKEGRDGCRGLLPYARAYLLLEGLSLAADGFDAPFVDAHMETLARTLLDETRRKMDMSLELCRSIRAEFDYETLYLVARAYIP